MAPPILDEKVIRKQSTFLPGPQQSETIRLVFNANVAEYD